MELGGQRIDASLIRILERLPVLSCYAKTRGWFYVISWLHRLTGLGLFVALTLHIYTLSSSHSPSLFDSGLKVPPQPIFVFIAWVSFPVMIFHALNGGRLILFELFGRRDDTGMVRWTFGLSAAYAAIVGLVMTMKDQRASAFFFWLIAFFSGAITAYVVASRVWKKRHSVLWKLQRVSAGFLFITVPAYILFMVLNPGEADGARWSVGSLQNVFTRWITLALAISALYHAGYGFFSIAVDYTFRGMARAVMTALIVVVFSVLVFFAFRLIFSV